MTKAAKKLISLFNRAVSRKVLTEQQKVHISSTSAIVVFVCENTTTCDGNKRYMLLASLEIETYISVTSYSPKKQINMVNEEQNLRMK